MKQEVKYRLSKWLIGCMEYDGIISIEEALALRREIETYYTPPFLCVEHTPDSIGDSVYIGERDDRYINWRYRHKVVCACCGSYYGPRPWHSNDKYRKVVWQCRGRWRKSERCLNHNIDDKELRVSLHQSARCLTIRLRVDKNLLNISGRVLDPKHCDSISAWMKRWKRQDIMRCMSDESDLLIVVHSIIVHEDGVLEYLFMDSNNVDYELNERKGAQRYDKRAKGYGNPTKRARPAI